MKDIVYGTAGGVSLRLDACLPEGEGPFPIVILVHGGGWGSGDKGQDFTELLNPLTDSGIVWFSVNYRLAPQHRWPACFEDIQKAITWVRDHAADYHADPKRIAVIGYSAGGQLATLAAMRASGTIPLQAVVGLAPAVDLVADSKRRGVVSPSLQNLLGLPELLDDGALAKIATISPAEEIKPDLPPFLLVQGTDDQSVRHSETIAFAGKLRKADVTCDLMEMKHATHRIADWVMTDPAYPDKVVSWLVAKLGKPGGGRAP